MAHEWATSPVRRVAHLVLSLQPGGLERLVCDLATSIRTSGFDAMVVCLDTDGVLAASLRQAGCRVRVVPRRPGPDPGLVLRLARVLRDEHVDVLHTHGLDPMFYGGFAARLAGVAVRIHTHHDSMLAAARRVQRLKFRLASRHFHAVVAVSNATRETLVPHHAGSGALLTIPNGIPEARYASRSANAPSRTAIGTVGRLASEKGLDTLIEAFALLRESQPGAELLIAGDGPERRALEALATQLGVRNGVSFLGYQERVADVLRKLTVFVLPSLTEGIPLALLEAMAAGVPVVASRVGGVPEVIVDDESGVLVPPGNAVALRDAIRDLLNDPDRRARLGRNGAQRIAERFSLSTMSAAYQALYRSETKTRWWGRPARRALAFLVPASRIMWRAAVRRPEISLTVDDGPDPESTPLLLEILRKQGARATFFVIGERAARFPEMVARIAADGHEIANHSYTHPDFSRLSTASAGVEIDRTERALEHVPAASIRRLFRPPRGALSLASTIVPWRRGYGVVLWSVDFKDFMAESAVDITMQLSGRRFVAGDVILYHGQTRPALEALPDILLEGARQGFRFVPVGELSRA